MTKPTFFKPLLQLDHDLISLLDRTRALASQIEATNTHLTTSLLTTVNDLTSDLIDAHMHLIEARRIEKNFRKG